MSEKESEKLYKKFKNIFSDIELLEVKKERLNICQILQI